MKLGMCRCRYGRFNTNMENGAEKRNKIIAVALGLAVIVVWVVVMFLNRDTAKEVKISGLKDALSESAPSKLVKSIEADVYKQLEISTNKKDINAKGAVRDGSSVIFKEQDNEYIGTVVIDVEAYKQSYLVYYAFNGNAKESGDEVGDYSYTTFFCLSDPDEIIYRESACDEASSLEDQNELYVHLPAYEYELESGKKVEFSFSYGNEVIITTDACNATVDKEPLIKKAKEWVESYKLDAADFKYSVPLSYENCLIK